MPADRPRIPRVIFVNRFYWPDEPATGQLLTDLAERLAALGNQIVVVASHPGRGDVPAEETRNGVRIIRVRSTRWSRGGLAAKAASFFGFFCGAIMRLLFLARQRDVIVAMTDPPLLGVGAWLVARMRRARLFHWVQDIYPELAMELAGQRWLRVTRPLRNAAWRGAERTVTLGLDMAVVLVASRVPKEKIFIAPNWAPAGVTAQPPGAVAELRAEWGLTGKFVVAYSGNLGRVHDLAPVLAVADELRGEMEMVFVFIGSGAQHAILAAEAQRRGLNNVLFRPAQPRTLIARTLALGDVHLVTLRAGCEHYVFPSKLYGIAAVARPVIFIGPRQCEVARLVESRNFGCAFEATETHAIAAGLRSLRNDPASCTRLGQAAAGFLAAGGGLAAATGHWRELLAPAGGLAVPRPPS